MPNVDNRTTRRAVFLYGFAKRERDNIDRDELTLRELALAWLAADAQQIAEGSEKACL